MSGIVCLLLLVAGSGGWESYTNTNFINDICGDDTALVFATYGGVVKFDAVGFRAVATVANTEGLPANRCLAVSRDRCGNVWVGTDGGGLAVISADTNAAQTYRPNDLPDKVVVLLWDEDRLLAGTDRGLYVIETRGTLLDFDDDEIRRFSSVSEPELLSDRVLALGQHGTYWVGTNRGVTAVDREFENWVGYRRPLGDSVKAIGVWADSLLIATEQGLAILEDSSFRPVFRFSPTREVFDLAIAFSAVYIATDTGVFRGQGTDSTTYSLILAADARALYISQAIWVGLGGNEDRGHGLRYSDSGQSWSSFYSGGVVSGQVMSCAFSPVENKLYACHYFSSSQLSEIALDNGTVTTRSGLLGTPIQVSCDSKGRAWYAHFSSRGGLSVYDPEADTWGKVQWGESSAWNIIDAFAIDQYDTKWVFNGGGVIVAVDSAGERAEFEIPGLVPPPGGGYDFAFDTRGCVYLGLTVGLVMLDYGGTLFERGDDRHEILVAGLPSSEVRSVAVDGEDRVWVATPQGVAVRDGSEFSVFTTANSGLLANNVYRARVDASGRVWFLCDVGLSMYDPVSGRWSNYSPQNSGLIPNSLGVTGFYSSLAVSRERGTLAVATLAGLSVFDFGAGSQGTSGAQLVVYPNPCVLGVHERVVLDSLPAGAAVVVRTLTGQPVATVPVDPGLNRAVWRPGDVATGVYLLVVTCPLGTRVERVAVISP